MLKKTCLLLTALILLLGVATAFAETPDLSQMTFEELAELRTLINAEMLTRPEAEDMVLGAGEYVVGRDLQPGTYYAIYESGTWSSGYVRIYKDETKEKRLLHISIDPYDIYPMTDLVEGNIIVVEYNAIRVNMTGFPDYHAPEGTLIPAGVYEIGVEIPAGKYSALLNTGCSSISVYQNMATYQESDGFFDTLQSYTLGYAERECMLNLQDGNILVVESNSILMNKYVATFTFD